jgi:hypothetical protein
MAKLLFDPVTYQFYYRCRSEESTRATAAGFGWDPIRRRYSTDDPAVAMALASRGDDYVKLLLADALEAEVLHEHTAVNLRHRKRAPLRGDIGISSSNVH